jgi:hypothetical protein
MVGSLSNLFQQVAEKSEYFDKQSQHERQDFSYTSIDFRSSSVVEGLCTRLKEIKIDRESAAATYDSTSRVFSEDEIIPEAGLKVVIDQGREAMKIERVVVNIEVADFALLREVHQEMGIKK